MQNLVLKALYIGMGSLIFSINGNADIRAGNVVIDANGIQVGGAKVAPGSVQNNGITINAGGVHMPGINISPGSVKVAGEDDDDADEKSAHNKHHSTPGAGAGEGAGEGAGKGAGTDSGQASNKNSKVNVNGNRGSIVIDGQSIRNQTIINRSNN